MKKRSSAQDVFLFVLCVSLLGAQSAYSNNNCVTGQLQQSLPSESAYDLFERVRQDLASRQNLTALDLVASVKALKGYVQSQEMIFKEYVSKVQDLDGPRLVSAANAINYSLSRNKVLQTGFLKIKNPTLADVEAVEQALDGAEATEAVALLRAALNDRKAEIRYENAKNDLAATRNLKASDLIASVESLRLYPFYQAKLFENFVSVAPELDGPQLASLIDSIGDSFYQADVLLKGFRRIAKPTAADVDAVHRALKRALDGQRSIPVHAVYLERELDKYKPLRAEGPKTASSPAQSDPELYEKVRQDLASRKENLTALDLVNALKDLKGNPQGQSKLFVAYVSGVKDLDGPRLVSAANAVNHSFERNSILYVGFTQIKNPTAADIEAVERALDGADRTQHSVWLREELDKRKSLIAEGPNTKNPSSQSTPSQASTPPKVSSAALDELSGMPGMEKVTDQLGKIREFLAVSEQRKKEGLQAVRPALHARFEGNPGTGKTTVARLYGKMLRELGFLKAPSGATEVPVIELAGTDFSSPDAVDKMKKAIANAQGGVLILDELYTADVAKNQYARDSMAVLLKEMEDKRDQFVVIGTGYSKEMDNFISSNDGFKRRFAQKVNFEDYDDPTLEKILKKIVREKDYHVDDAIVQSVVQKISRQRGKGFGNAGTVRNEFEAAIQRHAVRLSNHPNATKEELKTLTLEDFHPPLSMSVHDRLAALDKMVGLDDVKKNVHSVVSLLEQEKARAQHGIKSDRPLLNAVFEGNPGTGKTTVAEMYGSLLKDLGYVSNGNFIYVKASDLIGDVVGASEAKTKEVLKRAKGGVLFIDEAYRLYQPEAVGGGGSNSFGKAALDTLVEEIKPDANQDMVVILAGYPREMASMKSANSGLARRFPRDFHFADYNPEQLMRILRKKAKEKDFELSPQAEKAALAELGLRRSAKDFGNAGEVENLLGAALLRQSERLAATKKGQFTAAELKELRPEDFLGPRKSPDDVLKQLDSSPGLTSVKRALHDIKDTFEEAALVNQSPQALLGGAFSFEGHSPEEQQKVAEVLGELLHSQGVLPKKSIEVADSADLKGQYIGESATKTRRLLENSLGKTLIIKDLGAISNPKNPYEKEAIDTIASFLQQNHGKVAVVFSGTPEEVSRFTSLNPQIARRIEHTLEFHDLSAKESADYLSQLFHGAGKSLSPSATSKLNEVMSQLLAEPGWGNAKNLENFKAKILIKQAVRSKRNPGSDAAAIEAQDIEAAMPQGLLRRQPASSFEQHDVSLDVGRARGRVGEQETVATESHSASSHANPRVSEHQEKVTKAQSQEAVHEHHNHHEHDHAKMNGNELSELGIKLSDRSKKIMNGLEDLLNPNDLSGVEEMKQSIRQGKLSQRLLEDLAKKLQMPTDPESLSRLSADASTAIQEMKKGAETLKERAKTDEKAKKIIKHYVCLACGRTTCNYMPYTWFTAE